MDIRGWVHPESGREYVYNYVFTNLYFKGTFVNWQNSDAHSIVRDVFGIDDVSRLADKFGVKKGESLKWALHFVMYLCFCPTDVVELLLEHFFREVGTYYNPIRSHNAKARMLSFFVTAVFFRLPEVKGDAYIIEGGSIGHYYKLKKHGGASTKVNIHANEVIAGCRNECKSVYASFVRLSGLFTGLYDDQVAAVLLYAVAVSHRERSQDGVDRCVQVGLAAVRSETGASVFSLSDIIKREGLAPWLADYVELKCLLGRGVNEIDVIAKAMERLQKPIHPYAFTGHDDVLRAAIKEVMCRELPVGAVLFRKLDDFWSSRWIWAANGGHSRALEHAHPELATRKEVRAYRKCVLEQWKDNPMPQWDGKVYVTPSQKLEHGKSRLLLACDTLSYLWFEYFLKPVETAWQNVDVILNPGHVRHDRIAADLKPYLHNPLRHNETSRDVVYSLDFEDFNSQHSLTAQKMVFEVLFEHLGISNTDTQRIIESFDNMIVYSGKDPLGKVVGTLMSGHRATTFINTILNAAYIIGAGINCKYHKHVGDDVLMVCGEGEMVRGYAELAKRGVRCNPSKQCASIFSCEFLRVAHCCDFSQGYISRAIASAVSGNWVADHVLDKREALTNAIMCTRSVINRTGSGRVNSFPRVIAMSVAKRTCVENRFILPLLEGSACLGDGVVYGCENSCVTKVVLNSRLDVAGVRDFEYETHATADYLRFHTSTVEATMLEQYGADIADIMAQSSWTKSMEASSSVSNETKFSVVYNRVPMGQYVVSADALRNVCVEGVFERYPLLMMIKERIPLAEALDLARALGYECKRGLASEVWGSDMMTCVIDGYLPYTIACELAKQVPCSGTRIYVTHNIYA